MSRLKSRKASVLPWKHSSIDNCVCLPVSLPSSISHLHAPFRGYPPRQMLVSPLHPFLAHHVDLLLAQPFSRNCHHRCPGALFVHQLLLLCVVVGGHKLLQKVDWLGKCSNRHFGMILAFLDLFWVYKMVLFVFDGRNWMPKWRAEGP